MDGDYDNQIDINPYGAEQRRRFPAAPASGDLLVVGKRSVARKEGGNNIFTGSDDIISLAMTRD